MHASTQIQMKQWMLINVQSYCSVQVQAGSTDSDITLITTMLWFDPTPIYHYRVCAFTTG